jgi:hypothetical protein
MRYAAAYKPDFEPLDQFIMRKSTSAQHGSPGRLGGSVEPRIEEWAILASF